MHIETRLQLRTENHKKSQRISSPSSSSHGTTTPLPLCTPPCAHNHNLTDEITPASPATHAATAARRCSPSLSHAPLFRVLRLLLSFCRHRSTKDRRPSLVCFHRRHPLPSLPAGVPCSPVVRRHCRSSAPPSCWPCFFPALEAEVNSLLFSWNIRILSLQTQVQPCLWWLD